jgi:PiT family inorganic phosphate transporter
MAWWLGAFAHMRDATWVLAALLVASGHIQARTDGTIPIAGWIPLSADCAIAAGTLWGGWQIIEAMGLRITSLHAGCGLAASVGAMTAIFGATGLASRSRPCTRTRPP